MRRLPVAHSTPLVVLAALTAPLARPPAAAQAAVAVIQVGQTVTDSLSGRDLQFRDSTRFRRYRLPSTAGQSVTVDLVSDEFDAYLILERDPSDQFAMTDDGGGGCHARLVYTPSDARSVTVVVNTAAKHQEGRYTLRVSAGALPLEPRGPCRFRDHASGERTPASGATGRRIAVGQEVAGEVTTADQLLASDSTYAQAWIIEGEAGQTVTIDLESQEFDPFLYLDGPGLQRALQDDDSGGNCNARLTATFPRAGLYTIVVNTAARHGTGKFRLGVAAGARPPSLARCARVR